MKWEDPPSGPLGPGRKISWKSEADELRANPGCWGVLLDLKYSEKNRRKVSNLQQSVARGINKAFAPGGSFEAVSHNTDGHSKLYVRYVGQP